MPERERQPTILQDEEVKNAIRELFSDHSFVEGMKAFLPAPLASHILEAKEHTETVFDFQKHIIHPLLKTLVQISITELSSSGLERLDPSGKYLFISNHRDIGLDSAFLNMILFDHNLPTSQIATGENLMANRIPELIFKINKSFVVKRSGSARELYEYSLKLSRYIHDLIVNKQDSVWIAQREGRAKDGNDKTQVGLLKMLSLCSDKDLEEHFRELQIVPVSISYEYDPCDILKTREYLRKKADPDYRKSIREDVEHILRGLKGQKGRVHFEFGKLLDEKLKIFNTAANSKQQLELLAALIDRSIHLNYRLHPVNYIAHDLLTGSEHHAYRYSPEERQQYLDFFAERLEVLPTEEYEAGRQYLLGIYANPVSNAEAYEQ